MAETIEAAPVTDVSSSALEGTTNTAAIMGHDSMSFLNLFLHADIVVKLVIIILIVASVWSWTIIFEKWSKFKTVKFKAQRFETTFWAGTSLEQLYENMKSRARNHPMAQVFVAAMEELQKSGATALAGAKEGIKERVSAVMHVTKNRALEDLEDRLNFLASGGSATPFVGLFGTVWGIMNSFSSIASARNVSLAIVAPGIAEALFATAVGLAAAIPAVVAYNRFATELDKFAGRLDDFSDEFETLISRQLDEGKL